MLKLIHNIIEEGLEIAQFYDYNVKLNKVTLHTDDRYLGLYYPDSKIITIWEGLSIHLDEVVLHELSHAIQMQFEPEKRFHGRNWQTIMKELFYLPPRAKIPF